MQAEALLLGRLRHKTSTGDLPPLLADRVPSAEGALAGMHGSMSAAKHDIVTDWLCCACLARRHA